VDPYFGFDGRGGRGAALLILLVAIVAVTVGHYAFGWTPAWIR
jgi:hypothetical protein